MNVLELATTNLTSPAVLAFALGMIAVGIRSDLRLPEALYSSLTIYLLLAIGLKGGVELSKADLSQVWLPAVAAAAISLIIPVLLFPVLRKLLKLTVADSAAMGAHYGSVSVVTFTAGITFLGTLEVPYEGFLPTLLAIMEIPGIIVALLLARSRTAGGGDWKEAIKETLSGRSIVLLAGGLLIGVITGPDGMEQVSAFFVAPFVGVLTLFLLELGMTAARRLPDVAQVGTRLVVFAVVTPAVLGIAGVLIGTAVGLSLGGSTILGVLAASASYIAAPAAVRVALPEANPGLYLTSVLAITFPFNLVAGIPLYYAAAQLIH
jgi:uncharacterized protein